MHGLHILEAIKNDNVVFSVFFDYGDATNTIVDCELKKIGWKKCQKSIG